MIPTGIIPRDVNQLNRHGEQTAGVEMELFDLRRCTITFPVVSKWNDPNDATAPPEWERLGSCCVKHNLLFCCGLAIIFRQMNAFSGGQLTAHAQLSG